jgi:hypothetical protein
MDAFDAKHTLEIRVAVVNQFGDLGPHREHCTGMVKVLALAWCVAPNPVIGSMRYRELN